MTNFKEVAMAVGIAVLSALFIILLVDAFYESPKYLDFCEERFERPVRLVSPEECDLTQTEEEIQCLNDDGMPRYDFDDKGCQVFSSCDLCSKEYRAVSEKYNKNIFLIMAPLGILLILFGVLYKVAFLGSGFMFGGIIVLAYGTIRFFADMNKYVRVIVIFIELILLLLIGIKKVKK
ncbi:MAG: hypothetical protein ABIB47_04785 [Candidatus Woesearchaeota archaeon]